MAILSIDENIMFLITGINMEERFFIFKWCEDARKYIFFRKLWAIDYIGKREVSPIGYFPSVLKNMHVCKNMDNAFITYLQKNKDIGTLMSLRTLPWSY